MKEVWADRKFKSKEVTEKIYTEKIEANQR